MGVVCLFSREQHHYQQKARTTHSHLQLGDTVALAATLSRSRSRRMGQLDTHGYCCNSTSSRRYNHLPRSKSGKPWCSRRRGLCVPCGGIVHRARGRTWNRELLAKLCSQICKTQWYGPRRRQNPNDSKYQCRLYSVREGLIAYLRVLVQLRGCPELG